MRFVPSNLWTAGAFVVALAAASIVCEQKTAGESPAESSGGANATHWVAPARACRTKNPIPADITSIHAGRAVYCDQCLCCHGSNGKGDGPSASDLNPHPDDLSIGALRAEPDGALFWKITNGRDPMPGFDTLLAPKDRWNVINYLRTLEPKPATVASTHNSEEAANN